MTASFAYDGDGIPAANNKKPLKAIGIGCGALFLLFFFAVSCVAMVGGSTKDSTRTVTSTVISTVVKSTTHTVTKSPSSEPAPPPAEPAAEENAPEPVVGNEVAEEQNQIHGFVAPPPAPEPAPASAPAPAAYYRNCGEAKAAGAAPLYLGSPGYRSDLDRDGDGVACER